MRPTAAQEAAEAQVRRELDGLVQGTEHVAPVPEISPKPSSSMTFRELGEMWTSNTLATTPKYRSRVKVIGHADNIRRLEKYVYNVEYEGRKIGDTPLVEFTEEHGDAVLAEPSIPEGSLRHVAQCVHRILALAVRPMKLIKQSPLPVGWLPPVNDEKQRVYLFPHEDALLMGCTDIPLVRRIFMGYCDREGQRKNEAARLRWANLTLDLPNGGGMADIGRTKNGKALRWPLDPGTAEALRRWRTICPSTTWVFPAEELPRHRRRNKGKHMSVGNMAHVLRLSLVRAGVSRARLFESTEAQSRVNAHDLRATFVTLALAVGQTENWVQSRTGHGSSQMIARYTREAETIKELGLGWLKPLHEVIPELAAIDLVAPSPEPQLSANCRPDNDADASPPSVVVH